MTQTAIQLHKSITNTNEFYELNRCFAIFPFYQFGCFVHIWHSMSIEYWANVQPTKPLMLSWTERNIVNCFLGKWCEKLHRSFIIKADCAELVWNNNIKWKNIDFNGWIIHSVGRCLQYGKEIVIRSEQIWNENVKEGIGSTIFCKFSKVSSGIHYSSMNHKT